MPVALVKAGDWVRFYQGTARGSELRIGVVQYIKPRASWERVDRACTDIGEVALDQIFEVRIERTEPVT